MTDRKMKVKFVCKEDCGNSPKKLFLRDFNVAAAKAHLSFIKKSLTEDVVWSLFEPAGQKIITGRENVLQEYKENLVIVPTEFVIDTIVTHGYDGAVNGRIKAEDGKSYVFSDFYEFNSAKGVKIKSMTSYIFDFAVNKNNKTVNIKREFAAPLNLVWDAWTKAEILDQWWAPKPFQSKTKYMDFKVGGRRFYAMVSPEGVEMGWQIQEYISISPKTHIKFLSAFADKDENLNLPGSNWDLNFSELNETTTVYISIYNESRERMEKMIEMGFKEGFTSTLQYLEDVLSQKKQ